MRVNDNKLTLRTNIKSGDIRIELKSICLFLFGMQYLLANIAKSSIVYEASAALFIIAVFVYLFTRKAIVINKYYLVTFIFILFNLIVIVFGDTINNNHSFRMLITISLNLTLYIVAYSLLRYIDDTNRILNLFVRVTALINIIIIIIFRDTLFTRRLAFSWDGTGNEYYVFGIEFITIGSNGLAFISAIAFLFSTYLYRSYNFKNKIYLFYNFLFLLTILATGSRKGLLVLVVGYILMRLFFSNFSKKVIYGLLFIMFIPVVYYIITKVPVFYETMGYRVEELLNLVLNKNVEDPSINTRIGLIEMATTYIQSRPLMGYGLDAFRLINPWGIISDNNYLEILVSSGFIGFIIYYSYVLFLIGDFIVLKTKSNICKLAFIIFLCILLLEIGSVTYYERNYGFVFLILYYILYKEKSDLRLNSSQKTM